MKADKCCPSCGYCPHCGRSDAPAKMVPYPGSYPVAPYPAPIPWLAPYRGPYWIGDDPRNAPRIICGVNTSSGVQGTTVMN